MFEAADNVLQTRAEALLEEMVNIDSTTPDVAGVKRIQEIVSRELLSMGFLVRTLENPDPTVDSGHLIEGILEGESAEFITFVSHADTVLDVASVGHYRRLPDSLHARGSGVIDNKGGLVVALEGLRAHLEGKKNSRPDFSLRFVCSPNEEAGSPGWHDYFRKCAIDSKVVLGFEPALENGSIIESRRGNRWYEVVVEGREAHAGRCRGEQVNAAHDLAMKIARLHKLTNVKAGLSVNVGHIEGGRDRFNVVCGRAGAKIDARFGSFESREKLHKQIEKILLEPAVVSPLTGETSRSTYTIADDCPPFSSTSDSRSLLKAYLKAVARIEGRTIVSEKAGGAGDVNYMSREGVVVLDGFGPIGGKMHTTEEFVFLPSLSTRSLALAAFLSETPSALAKKRLRDVFLAKA